MVPDGFGTYNLATIMGGGEVVFELNELIDHAGWNKVWNQYCRLHTAPKSVVARDNTTGTEGEDARYARPGRLSAYLYRQTKNPAYAAKAWSGVRIPNMTTRSLKGPEVLNAIEEVSGLSTNSVSQGHRSPGDVRRQNGVRWTNAGQFSTDEPKLSVAATVVVADRARPGCRSFRGA
jgi:hypothetical protein